MCLRASLQAVNLRVVVAEFPYDPAVALTPLDGDGGGDVGGKEFRIVENRYKNTPASQECASDFNSRAQIWQRMSSRLQKQQQRRRRVEKQQRVLINVTAACGAAAVANMM